MALYEADKIMLKQLAKLADAVVDNNTVMRELLLQQGKQHEEFLSFLEKRDRNHAELEEVDLRQRRLTLALDEPVQNAVLSLRTEDDVKLAAFALYATQLAEYRRAASLNKEAADAFLHLTNRSLEEPK
jgi:hypothetical protein